MNSWRESHNLGMLAVRLPIVCLLLEFLGHRGQDQADALVKLALG